MSKDFWGDWEKVAFFHFLFKEADRSRAQRPADDANPPRRDDWVAPVGASGGNQPQGHGLCTVGFGLLLVFGLIAVVMFMAEVPDDSMVWGVAAVGVAAGAACMLGGWGSLKKADLKGFAPPAPGHAMVGEHLAILQLPDGIQRVGFVACGRLDEAMIRQIGEKVVALAATSDNPRILVSFKGVEHLSSAALALLITLKDKVAVRGGRLRLSDMDPKIEEVFCITRLDELFVIHPDEAAALESIRQ